MHFEFIFLKDHSNNALHRVEMNLEAGFMMALT